MADYRNVELKFINAGLDLNLPAEGIQPIKWRRLENVGVRTEGVMEARGRVADFFSSAYFDAASLAGGDVVYPDDFVLGRLTYISYVGPLADGTPGWLTIHEAPGNQDWPDHEAGNSPYYSAFLNGVPLLEVPNRLEPLASGQSPYAPLMVSQHPPSVTRALTPNGVTQVIIDGRWKIFPSLIDITSLGANYLTWGGTDTAETISHIPAYSLAVSLDPLDSTATGPVAEDSSTASGPSTGDYIWKVTYKNKATGVRSIASWESNKLTDPESSVNLKIPQPTDPQATYAEVWRKGGTIGNSWRLVGGFDTGSTATSDGATEYYTFVDDQDDADIALNEALDTLLVQPFPTTDSSGDATDLLTSAEGALEPLITFGPFNGQYTFWLGDPVKRNTFYWSNTSRVELSSADENYNVITEPGEELINGFISGGNPFIFSRRKLYALDWGGPTAVPAFVPREIPIGSGLAARWAFAATKNGVFFLAKDGIYASDCSAAPAENISSDIRPIFVGGQDSTVTLPWVDWSAEDALRLVATSRELFFFYKGKVTGEYICLRFDFAVQRWNQIKSPYGWRLAYELENSPDYRVAFAGSSSPLAFYSDDIIYETAAESVICRARTGSWNADVPTTDKEFGVLLLDLDPDGAQITLTPRYNSDSESGTPITINAAGAGGGRQLKTFSLGDVFKRSLSLEFEWTDASTVHPKFYLGTILFRVDEEGVVHWYHPPTALGEGAWFHIKDSYWTLKSSAAVTLVVNVDGVEDTYTLASTGGVRSKIYVEHIPRKGKLFSFKLDSASPFYLYGEESGINGKKWKTASGYQLLNPFAAAGYAQYLRTQGGT